MQNFPCAPDIMHHICASDIAPLKENWRQISGDVFFFPLPINCRRYASKLLL